MQKFEDNYFKKIKRENCIFLKKIMTKLDNTLPIMIPFNEANFAGIHMKRLTIFVHIIHVQEQLFQSKTQAFPKTVCSRVMFFRQKNGNYNLKYLLKVISKT